MVQHLCLFISPMWKNILKLEVYMLGLRRNTLVVGYLSSTSNVYVARLLNIFRLKIRGALKF